MTELNKAKEKALFSGNPQLICHDELAFIDKPFYFPGENGRAVLLVHGWTTTPYELRRLGKYLHSKGYTVFAPLLTGHGTVPSDLEGVTGEMWNDDVEQAYDRLREKHGEVYAIGTSLGASLVSILAGNNPKISGLVLMAMPYAVRMEKFLSLLARIILPFKKYNKKYYPPSFGLKTMVTRKISYQTYPIKSAFEAYKIIKLSRRVISKVSQPCFVLQSSIDHVVTKKSLEKIFEKISSKVKQKKYIPGAYHTFISDIENEHIFEEILEFLDTN
jgi:carboxylesterase